MKSTDTQPFLRAAHNYWLTEHTLVESQLATARERIFRGDSVRQAAEFAKTQTVKETEHANDSC